MLPFFLLLFQVILERSKHSVISVHCTQRRVGEILHDCYVQVVSLMFSIIFFDNILYVLIASIAF